MTTRILKQNTNSDGTVTTNTSEDKECATLKNQFDSSDSAPSDGTFSHPLFGELHIKMVNGKEYFPATQCAKILGYANTKDAILRHCKGVVKHDLPTRGGIQSINYIPEGDLYRLIIRSRLPEAEKFERWVFDEVLPSIRKTGTYSITQKPDSYTISNPVERAKRWIEEYEEKQMLMCQVDEMQPKVEYHDAVLNKESLFAIGIIAKDIGVSAQALNKIMNKNRIIFKQSGTWKPYAEYEWLVTEGYCDYVSYTQEYSVPQLKWSERGRRWIMNNIDDWRRVG